METKILKFAIAGVVLFAFGGIVAGLILLTIPEQNKDVFIHTIGIIEGAIIGLVNYYWGSSQGSADKNEIIKKQP